MRFAKGLAAVAVASIVTLAGCGERVEINPASSTSSTSAESSFAASNESTSEAVAVGAAHDEIINEKTADGVVSAVEEKSGEISEIVGENRELAEKSAKIIAGIERENISAAVSVSFIDFTLDGIPEVVVSYDTGSGHSYVENDVYNPQSANLDKAFSFRSSGISRDYAPSVFLYESESGERFFAFCYGLDSGNYLKSDFIDKLETAGGGYSVTNIFSATTSTEPFKSSYSISSEETDGASFEREKSEWLGALHECEFRCVEVPIKAAEWSDESALARRFEMAFAEFES